MSAARPMTPAERYYAFLDRTWAMNLMAVADLDTRLDAELVERKWREFAAVRVLARTVATAELTLADAGTARVDFAVHEAAPDTWDEVLADEALAEDGLDRPIRCRLLCQAGLDRSRLVLVGHHSVVGGRTAIAELQAFVRSIDGQAVPPQHELARPPTSGPEHPWHKDRRALLELLGTIGAQQRSVEIEAPAGWPRADVPRAPRFTPVVLDAERTWTLLHRARRHGARAFSSLAAAWLVAVAGEIGAGGWPGIQLNTPADVSVRDEDPARAPVMAVAVLTHRFSLRDPAPWPLAKEIARAVTESLARGEGELFFHLARADRISDLETGTRLVAASIAGAPPAVSVTNLGVVDAGADPAWLRRMFIYQASTPNQVVAVTGLGYRGQLMDTVSVDDNRLGEQGARRVLTAFDALIDEMSAPQR